VGGEAAGLVLGTQRHHEVITMYKCNSINVIYSKHVTITIATCVVWRGL